jgi:1-acyl-sn-glycerol-3-phosphate acyltransferase
MASHDNTVWGRRFRRFTPLIRTVFTLLFWMVATPVAALFLFPFTLFSGNVMPLYRTGTWIAKTGIRIAGVRVMLEGRERLDRTRGCIFMSNHVSNLDPPALIPLIPNRVSVLTKKEVFRIPVLGWAMRMASFVPIERSDREKAIESIGRAAKVLRSGISMMIFVEGTRSPDGRLLPFKKGPFHLAAETGAPIIPVTIVGSRDLLPKGKLVLRPGVVRIVFHPPIDPAAYSDKETLIAAVRDAIASALPPDMRLNVPLS